MSETLPPIVPTKPDRLLGYDVARAAAIWGMITVHFSLVMSMERMKVGPLAWLVGLLDGRAAATFMTVAGVGLTLRAARANDRSAERRALLRRSVFLLIAGMLNLLIWPGDILRVYGVGIMIAAFFLWKPASWLWGMAVFFVVGFVLLILTLDYEKNWDWAHLEYRNLWTVRGQVRNLFFDGFRTVFPWLALLFLGMWIGRLDVSRALVRRRLIGWGLAAMVAAEIASRVLGAAAARYATRLDPETVHALFGTESLPPLPIFLLSAAGAACAAIGGGLALAAAWPGAWPVRALAATGRMALTWYVLHIVLGLGGLVMLGADGRRPLEQAIAAAAAFFAAAVVVSWAWSLRFRLGPLEWIMRSLTAS